MNLLILMPKRNFSKKLPKPNSKLLHYQISVLLFRIAQRQDVKPAAGMTYKYMKELYLKKNPIMCSLCLL